VPGNEIVSDLWRHSLDLEGRPTPPVSWTCAAPPGDLPALRRWRAAVGPVRVGDAAPGVTPPDRAAGWPLTVAVWNANVGGGAVRLLWDHLAGGDGASTGTTVLLLQEVFASVPAIPSLARSTATPAPVWASRIAPTPSGEPRADIVSFARQAGLSLVYAPSMRNGNPAADPPEDRGNAILANLPLGAHRAIELPFERQRRVAVAADATVGDTTITFCSVHLDNRSPWRRVWRTLGAARRRQMAGLLDVFPVDAVTDAQVLGGDLNTWVGGRREGAYRLARARFPLPAQPDPRPTHHFEIGGWLRHSDHLLFRLPPGWNARYRRLDDTFGSDHYPLVGTLGPATNYR